MQMSEAKETGGVLWDKCAHRAAPRDPRAVLGVTPGGPTGDRGDTHTEPWREPGPARPAAAAGAVGGRRGSEAEQPDPACALSPGSSSAERKKGKKMMRGERSRGSQAGGETAVGRAGGEGSQRAEQKGGSEGKEEQEARGEHEAGNRATRQDPQPRSPPAPPLLLPEPAPGSWGPRPARTLQAERSAVWKCCRASLKEMRGTAPDFPGSPAGSPGAASAPPASKSAPELPPARPPPTHPRHFWGTWLDLLQRLPFLPRSLRLLAALCRGKRALEVRSGEGRGGAPCRLPPAPHTAAPRPLAEPKPGPGGSAAPRGFHHGKGADEAGRVGGSLPVPPPNACRRLGCVGAVI